jgi:hypothetical protein
MSQDSTMKMSYHLNALIADAVKATRDAVKGARAALAGLLGRGQTPVPAWVRVTPPEVALRRSRAYWGARPGYGRPGYGRSGDGERRSGRLQGGC